MNLELLLLAFYEFFKTGLFALGGGLATIPFLTEMMNKYHWFTADMLTDMIAVSESTPGAIGINMATYTGYHINGVLGGIIATLGLVAPSIIVICIVAQFLKKFKDSELVKSVFYGIRPAVTALIASAGITIFIAALFQDSENFMEMVKWPCILLLAVIFIYRINANGIQFYALLLPPLWVCCFSCRIYGKLRSLYLQQIISYSKRLKNVKSLIF